MIDSKERANMAFTTDKSMDFSECVVAGILYGLTVIDVTPHVVLLWD